MKLQLHALGPMSIEKKKGSHVYRAFDGKLLFTEEALNNLYPPKSLQTNQ
jgi:hypothetical protein